MPIAVSAGPPPKPKRVKKTEEGIGVYTGQGSGKRVAGSRSGGAKGKVSEKMKRRNDKVKELMKANNWTLRKASSYIKENNIPY